MSEPASVLVVAHQTAATARSARRGPRARRAKSRDVPSGRPAPAARDAQGRRSRGPRARTRPAACSDDALPKLSAAAGQQVTGSSATPSR